MCFNFLIYIIYFNGDIMKNIKFIGYSLLFNITLLIFLLLITTILSYFNIISNNLLKIILLIMPIITTLFSNIYLGSKVTNKGYIEGLKHGILFVIILFLLNILLYRYLNIKNIIGINIKRKF